VDEAGETRRARKKKIGFIEIPPVIGGPRRTRKTREDTLI
jgi:hypothetical protein